MEGELKGLFKKVLAQIKPTTAQRGVVNAFVRDLNAKLRQRKLQATAILGGSMAKGTFLKNDHDVDIFVRFDKRYKSDQLSDLLAQALPKGVVRVHGSRDYFQLRQENLYEIAKDPDETRDLSTRPEHRERMASLRRQVLGQHRRLRRRGPGFLSRQPPMDLRAFGPP